MFGRSASASGPTANTGFSFGGSQQSNNTGGLFGAKPATPVQSTGFSFGNNNAQQQNGNAQASGTFGARPTLNPSGFGQVQQTSGGLFGNNASSNTSGGLFGNSSNTTNNNNNIQTTGGLFGNNNTQTQPGLFGTNKPASGGLFGNTNTNNNAPATGGLFGNNGLAGASSNTSGGGLGSKPLGGGLFGNNTNNNTQPSTGGGLFSLNNNNNNSNNNKIGGGLFGNNANTQSSAASGGLFGAKPATGGGLFGTNNNNGSTSTGGLFGNNNNTTLGGGLFGGSNNNNQQQLQQQQQQQQPQLPPLSSMTRVNELPEALQNQLEEFDNYIQLQMSIAENLKADEANHKELIESIPRDVNFLESKYVTVNQTLNSDLKFIEQFKTKELDLFNKWVEKLLKIYLQITGLLNGSTNNNGPISIQTLDAPVSANATATLNQFFIMKVDDFQSKIDNYKSILQEIENTIDGLDKISIDGLDKHRGTILAFETLKDQFQLFMELSNNMAEIHHEVKKLTGPLSSSSAIGSVHRT